MNHARLCVMLLGSVWHLTGPTLAKPVESIQMQTLADARYQGHWVCCSWGGTLPPKLSWSWRISGGSPGDFRGSSVSFWEILCFSGLLSSPWSVGSPADCWPTWWQIGLSQLSAVLSCYICHFLGCGDQIPDEKEFRGERIHFWLTV